MKQINIVLNQNDLTNLEIFAKAHETINETVQRLTITMLENIYLVNDFKYNIKTNKLYRREKQIIMTKKEMLLFQYLLERSIISDDCYTNIELIKKDVWKDNEATIYSIRNKIMSIRDKTSKELIINKNNHGYRINLLTKF